jgi:signal transduction histidine kinase
MRATARELAATFGLEFRVEAPIALRGWWAAPPLRRALENLGSNAAKYGDPARPVTLSLSERDAGGELSVHNEGDPIPASVSPGSTDLIPD